MTAALRYGRRGGGWVVERDGRDVCHTCRSGTAVYEARHRNRPEVWLSCGRCRTQAHTYGVQAVFVPLTRAACPACGATILAVDRPTRCPACGSRFPEAA